MKLNEKQLECMRLGADKTLSFGCIINTGHQYESYIGKSNTLAFNYSWRYKDVVSQLEPYYFEKIKVIGHPITYSRLSYLYRSQPNKKLGFIEMTDKFIDNLEYFNQSILDRPEELIDLVLSFLQSLNGTNNKTP